MKQARSIARKHGFDALIVLAALESALEVALRHDGQGPTSSHWFAVPAVAVMILPLLARHRFPFAAPALVWLIAAGLSFADGQLVGFTGGATVAGMAAAFLLGNLSDSVQERVGLMIVIGAAAIIVYNDPSHAAGDFVFLPGLFSIGWLAGFALRERADQAQAAEERAAVAERERDAAARIAVAEERARIARELHDVVAHAVSVMVLQVGAVRHRSEAAPEDTEALETVERTGRAALAEMRRLLGAMRRDDEDAELAPQPGLESLDALLDQVRGAGLTVRLHVEGEPASLPHGLDVSAYRIVQEGLTNVLKHANASEADVTLGYDARDLRIEVRDNGSGGASRGDGLGHGLVGVRERVKIYGGEVSAGSANGRGFVLSTRLPLRSEER